MSTNDADDSPGAAAGQSVSLGERLGAVVRVVDSPTDWALVRADNAAAKWTALRGWVEWLRREFGFDHRVVPPCWYLLQWRHLVVMVGSNANQGRSAAARR